MTKYSKASDSLVKVVDANGKEHKVTRRAFDIVYKSQGFTLLEAGEVDDTPEEVTPEEAVEVDYFSLTREELRKVSNDDLKAFLDKEEIEYVSKAIKEDLIDLVLGE